MSGVRAHNPELTALGLSLPGFLERGRVIASLPSLSLLTLAALTPPHHEVTYHEVADVCGLAELPPCDLAAISTYSAQAAEAYALCERFRAAGAITVIGGLHVTAVPLEAMEHADVVVVGEGEPVWARLLADAEQNRLQPVYQADGGFDLATAPMPRFELLDPDRYNRLTVQTQRGCRWRCEFCASSLLLTDRYKAKPVASVAAELREIKRLWPRPFIELADDNTFVGKRRSRALAEAIGHEGVRWFTETDISVAEDPELLGLLRDAGCAELLIGLESPSSEGVDGLELKRNWKHAQHSRYEEAIDAIQSFGIACNACFVLGLDGDGPGVFDAVERFVERTHPFDVQITVLTPFPGTPLYRRLLDEGRILRPGEWGMCTLFDVNFRPKGMTVVELEEGLVELGRRLYSEEATARRRSAFKEQWRTGRRSRVRVGR
jgi:radical SAM superfamily enzyme YgiQ (UPF0313 family)